MGIQSSLMGPASLSVIPCCLLAVKPDTPEKSGKQESALHLSHIHAGDIPVRRPLGRKEEQGNDIDSAEFAQAEDSLSVYTDDALPRFPHHGSNIPPPRDKERPLSDKTL